MDAGSIVSIISTVGFPITCCVAMAVYVAKSNQQQREDTLLLNEQHTEEMLAFKDEIKEALNNNTIALTKLCDRLDKEV